MRAATPRFAIVAVFLVIGLFAYSNHLVQDDGFIALRYADHWVRGYGPVWYPGSREFGYTNFLYVALVAGLMACGLGALTAAAMVGYGAFAASAILVFGLTKLITGSATAAAASVFLIFSNYVVSTFAHGLLESSLQLCWVLATYFFAFLYLERRSQWLAVATALAASLAVLTRLDSVLLLLPVAVYLLISVRWHPHLIPFLSIPLLILGTFLVWCQGFYGSFLPSTFYVKGDESRIAYGLWYLHSFLGNELYIYPIGILIVLFILFYKREIPVLSTLKDRRIILLFIASASWLLYVIYVGGDFIAFRLLLPFIVFFYLFFISILTQQGAYRIMAGFLAYSLIVVSSHWYIGHQKPEFYTRGSGIDSPNALRNYVTRSKTSWQSAGSALGKLFYTGSRSDPVIATTAAGAIPFHSRLQAIDMHGLNDIWVAKWGEKYSSRPGHYRIATKEYLDRRRVNLIIGHPQFECGNQVFEFRRYLRERYGDRPIVTIPVSSECWILALYFREHPRIEELIREGVITRR